MNDRDDYWFYIGYEKGKAFCTDEIESLHQQLLLKEHHYDVMKASAEVLAEQCEKYRQQLAECQKREVMLRSVCQNVVERGIGASDVRAMKKALSAAADLKDVRLCHAEPVTGFQDWTFNKYVPLYRAWEPKK